MEAEPLDDPELKELYDKMIFLLALCYYLNNDPDRSFEILERYTGEEDEEFTGLVFDLYLFVKINVKQVVL